jgi:hypothetical protein
LGQSVKKRTPAIAIRVAILAAILVAIVAYKFGDYFSQWNGTVKEKRDKGDTTVLVVEDSAGKRHETKIPRSQSEEVSIGDRVSKDRYSHRIKAE